MAIVGAIVVNDDLELPFSYARFAVDHLENQVAWPAANDTIVRSVSSWLHVIEEVEMIKKLWMALMLLAAHNAFPQGRLPACLGSYGTGWTNCSGELAGPGGDRYLGDFWNGAFNGQGRYTWASGDNYVGQFWNGARHGQGTFTYANGDKYVGEFMNDKPHGQGSSTFASGDKYVGEFRDGKFNGQGTLSLPNGNEYIGEFLDDKRNGIGTEYRADGSVLKAGVWQE